MGTLLEVSLYHEDAVLAEAFLHSAFREAERLDGLLSTYSSTSEISRFNNGEDPIALTEATCALIREGKDIGMRTGGAFALTVRPLVELWEAAKRRKSLPPSERLKDSKNLVGDGSIHLTDDCILASSDEYKLSIETGGIGKGFAVDAIVSLLERYQVEDVFISFGLSSVFASGAPPGKDGWRLLIAFPGSEPLGTVIIRDQALSASSALGRTFEIGDTVYGHIIDPVTGYPLRRQSFGIVVSPSATEAEVLSKVLLLRGEEAVKDFNVEYFLHSGTREVHSNSFFIEN